MSRKPDSACTSCSQPMPKTKMRSDGGSGLRCKPPFGCASKTEAPKADPPAQGAKKGKPAAPNERRCKICGCTEGAPCDVGAAQHCVLTADAEPICTACGQLVELAEERIAANGGTVPVGLTVGLYEDSDMPCLGETLPAAHARLADVITFVMARRRATAAAAEEPAAPSNATPAERTLPLPFAASDTSSPAASSSVVQRLLAETCDTCDAAPGEPCAWATAEPSSWAHEARTAKLSPPDRRELYQISLEDRIRALVDYHAGLPGDPPLPSERAITRALSDGVAGRVGDVANAIARMFERGELVQVTDRGATFYRRRGGPAVAMGRVGVPAPSAAALAGETAPPAAEKAPRAADRLRDALVDLVEGAQRAVDILAELTDEEELAQRRDQATTIRERDAAIEDLTAQRDEAQRLLAEAQAEIARAVDVGASACLNLEEQLAGARAAAAANEGAGKLACAEVLSLRAQLAQRERELHVAHATLEVERASHAVTLGQRDEAMTARVGLAAEIQRLTAVRRPARAPRVPDPPAEASAAPPYRDLF